MYTGCSARCPGNRDDDPGVALSPPGKDTSTPRRSILTEPRKQYIPLYSIKKIVYIHIYTVLNIHILRVDNLLHVSFIFYKKLYVLQRVFF